MNAWGETFACEICNTESIKLIRVVAKESDDHTDILMKEEAVCPDCKQEHRLLTRRELEADTHTLA